MLRDGNKGTWGTWNIWILPLNGGKPVWLTEGSAADWSPDGSELCFTYEDDIWKIPASGGSPVRLLETSEVQEDWPRWSPGGSKILFSSGAAPDIWIADVSRLLASR